MYILRHTQMYILRISSVADSDVPVHVQSHARLHKYSCSWVCLATETSRSSQQHNVVSPYLLARIHGPSLSLSLSLFLCLSLSLHTLTFPIHKYMRYACTLTSYTHLLYRRVTLRYTYSDFHNDCLFCKNQKKLYWYRTLRTKTETERFGSGIWTWVFFTEKKKDSHYGNQSMCPLS